MSEPASHELSERIAVLEERMKTLQSDLQGTLERFRADMADWKADMADWKADMADWKADMAKRDVERDAEAHRRDKDNLRWQIGLWVAAVVILGFLIRFSSVPAGTN